MAITFVADSTANSASANTLTPTEPAGTAENDLVIAFGAINTTGGTWTDPTDFTPIDARDSGVYNCYLGYKIRAATAGDGYQFTSSSVANPIALTLVTWRGIDTSTPLDVTFVGASHFNFNSSDVTSAAQAITTVTNGAVVVLFQHWNGPVTGFDLGEPASYTSRSEILLSSRVNFVTSRDIASAGTETPGAYTTTGTVTTQGASNWTLALRPAVAGGIVLPMMQGPNFNSFIKAFS